MRKRINRTPTNKLTRVYVSWGDGKWMMIIVHPYLFWGYPYPFYHVYLLMNYQLHKHSDWQHTSWSGWVCLLPSGTSKSKGELYHFFLHLSHLSIVNMGVIWIDFWTILDQPNMASWHHGYTNLKQLYWCIVKHAWHFFLLWLMEHLCVVQVNKSKIMVHQWDLWMLYIVSGCVWHHSAYLLVPI